jgi:hypothetical protein
MASPFFSLTLPPISELSALCGADANRFFALCAKRPVRKGGASRTKKATLLGCFVRWLVLTKKMPPKLLNHFR